MTRREAVEWLKNHPAKFGHLIGFDKLKDIHNEWIKGMITKKEDHTLQAARETYKTTCVSIAIALIMILLPRKRILFMRKTDSDVKEIIKQVRKILDDPHTRYFVRIIYGVELQFTVDSSTELSTNLVTDIRGTNQLVGVGIGASLTGKHYDYIFTDDIVNLKDRVSRAEREKTKLIYQELFNIVSKDGGRIYNTGTPWHKEDCFTLMPEPEKWDYKRVGMFSDEKIAELKDRMAPSLFAANYELRHIASDNIIFPEPEQGAPLSMIVDGISHVDSAFDGEDYTAFTIARYRDGHYYLFGKMWRKNVADCYEQIVYWHNKCLCGKLYTEKNADKGFVARDLKMRGLRAVTYNESMNKHTKIVTNLKAIWKDVIFVEDTDPEYIEQIVDYTEDAEHDDAPDSAACLARILYRKATKRRAE